MHICKLFRTTLLLLAAFLLILSQPIRASAFSLLASNSISSFSEHKLVAADGIAQDGYGYSVAISDDGGTVLVGTFYQYNHNYPIGPGDVYVYIRSEGGWVFQQKLPVPAMPDSDEFGYSLAISADGSTALVGAKGGDFGGAENRGCAYVFTRTDGVWLLQAQLIAADGATVDRFGISVALSDSGDTALVGAYVDDVGVNADQGSAYVFQRSAGVWSFQAQLTANDGVAGDYFGRSVSLSSEGSTALIGANMKKINTNSKQGAAYVFTRTDTIWSQQARLTADDGGAYDWLGASVSVSGDGNTALAGAEGHTLGANYSQGAAYVFTRSGSVWNQQAQLTALDGEESDMFGGAVALSADASSALVGVHWDMVESVMTGSVYVFTVAAGSWSQTDHLVASDGVSGDNYGVNLSISADGSIALVGADLATVESNGDQGAAYLYMRSSTSALVFLPMILQ